MARQLIGSSNVYRFYKPELFKGYAPYKMVACTNIEVLKVALDGIEDVKGGVTISVIENFVCKAAHQMEPEEEKLNAIKTVIVEYLNLIQEYALKNPRQKFALVNPMMRPKEKWYTDLHNQICKHVEDGIRTMDLQNVLKVNPSVGTTQVFEIDGVHLTPTAGKVFIDTILFNSEEFFAAQFIDLESEKENITEYQTKKAEKRDRSQMEVDFEKSVKSLDKKIEDLNKDIFRRRFQDSLVMARMREDVDTISNINKEDKMMISGMISKTPRPVGREEAKKWLKDIVSEILNAIEPGSASEIIFVSQGRSNNRDIPLAEVRLSNRETAKRLRKTFAQQKKTGKDFGRIYISNCVTLATRVRIEILKAMAKKFSSDREDLYVMGYASRPVVHVKPKEENQKEQWYPFRMPY